MSSRWIIVLCVIVGWALLWFIAAGATAESVIDLVFVMGGGFLIVRAGLLHLGRAQPSRWGGYTALGTFLIGIGAMLFVLEQRLESLAPERWLMSLIIFLLAILALVVGTWVDSRAGVRRQLDDLGRSNKR